MFHPKVRLAALLSVLVFGISGCHTMTPPVINTPNTTSASDAPEAATSQAKADQWKATYAKLALSGGKSLTVDPARSTVRMYAFRSGRAARLGHNHVLSAPQFAGFIYLPDAIADARFDLEFRLDQLEIDNPAYRAPLGKAFASVPSPEAIVGKRVNMLGEANLQADRYPFARIHSLQIAGEAPKCAARIQVELHGQTRDMWIPVNVEGLPDHVSASGSFVLRQSDFGIKPFSVMGGLLEVQDEIVIEFQLVGAA